MRSEHQIESEIRYYENLINDEIDTDCINYALDSIAEISKHILSLKDELRQAKQKPATT